MDHQEQQPAARPAPGHQRQLGKLLLLCEEVSTPPTPDTPAILTSLPLSSQTIYACIALPEIH